MRHRISYLILLLLISISCKENVQEQFELITAFNDNKVIKEILPKKQVYSISGKKDTALISYNGSMIIIDSLTFEDHKGNIVKDKIDITIFEAISVSEILRANLSTIGDSGILESDGMIFINALSDTVQLQIRNDKKITILLPNDNLKSNMSSWYGVINENSIIWSENDSIIKYLTPVELELLAFSIQTTKYVISKEEAPDGMTEAEAVKLGLILRDTLTLTLEQSNDKNIIESVESSFPEDVLIPFDCGIPSKYIELIKTPQFENTLIATREFEYRMKFIHRTCDVEVLKIYINNLDLNLWEIDRLVYEYLLDNENDYASQFDKFSKQKLTKIKEIKKLSRAIKQAIKKIDNMVKSDIEESRKDEDNFKRNNVFYQFEAKNLGWYNIDKYWKREDLIKISLRVIVPEIKNIDKIQIHLSIPDNKVFIPLSKIEKNIWGIVSYWEPKLPIENKGVITGVILNKKGEFFSIEKEFLIKNENTIEVKINKSDIDGIVKMFELTTPKIDRPENKPFDCCKSFDQIDYLDTLILGN